MTVLKMRDPGDGLFKIPDVGQTRWIYVVSSDVTAGSTRGTDHVYLCSGTMTVTLPTAVSNINRYTVKRSGTGTITIATTSSQTIDGASTYSISIQYQAVDLVSDGTNWVVI